MHAANDSGAFMRQSMPVRLTLRHFRPPQVADLPIAGSMLRKQAAALLGVLPMNCKNLAIALTLLASPLTW